jgi:hypothetical protein
MRAHPEDYPGTAGLDVGLERKTRSWEGKGYAQLNWVDFANPSTI